MAPSLIDRSFLIIASTVPPPYILTRSPVSTMYIFSILSLEFLFSGRSIADSLRHTVTNLEPSIQSIGSLYSLMPLFSSLSMSLNLRRLLVLPSSFGTSLRSFKTSSFVSSA